jgi:hypothetical protein
MLTILQAYQVMRIRPRAMKDLVNDICEIDNHALYGWKMSRRVNRALGFLEIFTTAQKYGYKADFKMLPGQTQERRAREGKALEIWHYIEKGQQKNIQHHKVSSIP